MHLWAKERQAGQQLILDQMWMGKFHEFTRASIGFCSAGHWLIRHFFLAVSNLELEYYATVFMNQLIRHPDLNLYYNRNPNHNHK